MSMMRIAVVRALHLGDMLCAVPALRALRAGFPDAEITLIGLPWARELIPLLSRYIDAFEEFPGFPGIPEREYDASSIIAFLERMQARDFDLAVQLHGSGSHINEFTALLGARRTAVFHDDGDMSGDDSVQWPKHGTEAARLLTLPLAIGCPDQGLDLDISIDDCDRDVVRAMIADPLDGRECVCVHPGARFPSRRWPAERFAAVADSLAEHEYKIVVTGTSGEAPVTRALCNAMHAPALDLTGKLTLGMFAALVSECAMVICNDTGISHVAAATSTPSVVVASGSDVARWKPEDASRHRVLWHDVPCRPCMHITCPTAHECATGVGVSDALRAAIELLASRPSHV
jgi:ADP-heptose:LPS heptosyltransferase